MNKALLIIFVVTFLVLTLALTITVVHAALTQQKQLRDLKEEMTELRIQVRAEFLRIQECLNKIESGRS